MKGLVTMDTKEYVEFLCLSCGLQGSRTLEDAEVVNTNDCCPKCGEKLLVISRTQPNDLRLSV